MKLYEYGLIVGRFQTLHNGHKLLVKNALELCSKLVIYIGSSQAYGTRENPFSYNVRLEMFEKVFDTELAQKRLIIRPLPDIGVGNNDIWGKYVLGAFEAEFHRQPDLYVTGCEKNRSSWFNNEIAPLVDELRVTRSNIDISGTECRALLKKGDREQWQKYVPQELWDMYPSLAKIMEPITMLKPIWLYRFEHTDPKKGAWYDLNGNYCCTNPLLKQLDMPYEPDIYKGVYRSACKSGKDLAYWIPLEAARQMQNEGYIFTRYLSDDYFERSHGEVCFNKKTYLKKEVVSIEEVYLTEGE